LAKDPSKDALSVFISYSHADEDLKDPLVKPLKRNGLISEWHDRKITGGEDFGNGPRPKQSCHQGPFGLEG
jgi:hypothetical protein